ncbi:MAG: tetratricopeptide repeat protein [Nitrospira sp.]|nr:tetratricopeptide repeat protein [Nitrospira sp.]
MVPNPWKRPTISNNLAALYKEKGLYAFAEPLYQRALNLRRAFLGESHPSVAMSLNNLANLYHAQGLSELADQRYREAFAVLEAVPDSPERFMGSILGNWALLAHERGLLEEAGLRYERALVIQQQTLGGTTRWSPRCVIAMPVCFEISPVSIGGARYHKGFSHPHPSGQVCLRNRWTSGISSKRRSE